MRYGGLFFKKMNTNASLWKEKGYGIVVTRHCNKNYK